MRRRQFLEALALGAVAGSVPRWLRAQGPADFAARLKSEPWLAGFATLGSEALAPVHARVSGHWPGSLAGTLYRNGPGWFDRAGLRYRHWFDGDGLVRAWRIGGGRVSHSARMVGTSKFTQEQRAGRFLVPAAGTAVPEPIAVRNNDDLNTANTSIARIGGRLFALWEAGSAIEIDPDTLATRGPKSWREDLTALPFSAHPLTDADGSTWNFGSLSLLRGGGLFIWHIAPDGTLRRVQLLESGLHEYLHAFAMTPRYLVFMLMPFRVDENSAAFFDGFRFASDQPCRIALVPKDALDAPRWIEAPFAAAYHFGDAYEQGDRVIMRVVRHHDLEEARSPMAAAMRGERVPEGLGSDLANLHLDLATGRAHWEETGVARIEFPAFDRRTAPGKGARLFAPTTVAPADAPYFNAVCAIDAERGRVETYRYGAHVMAEEHLFVPKHGGVAGQGWLLGTLLDYERGRSGLVLLDAARVGEGPVAQAWLPYTTPLGFHGCFDARG